MNTNKIEYSDIILSQNDNTIVLSKKSTLSKYLSLDKVDNVFNFYGGISIGGKFNNIQINKNKGFFIPNNTLISLDGKGFIANGKISWDKENISYADNSIPLSALKQSELSTIFDNIHKHNKIDKNNRGEKGNDGMTIITPIDTFNIITDEKNMVLGDYEFIIPFKVIRGNKFLKVIVSEYSHNENFNIYIDNSNEKEPIITIIINHGMVINSPNGVINFNLEISDFYTFKRGISWNIITQPSSSTIIERVVDNTPKHPRQTEYKDIVVINGGSLFIENENGEVYPSSLELQSASSSHSKPEWFIMENEKWIPIPQYKNKENIQIKYDIFDNEESTILYKVKYGNVSSTIPISIIRHHKFLSNVDITTKQTTSEIICNEPFILEKIPYFLNKITPNDKNDDLVLIENKSFTDSFTGVYIKELFISSDRISHEDYPLTSKLSKDRKYTLTTDLDISFISPKFDSNIEYEITTSVITDKTESNIEKITGNYTFKGNTMGVIPLKISFTNSGKSLRFKVIVHLNTSSKEKIDFFIKNKTINISEFKSSIGKAPKIQKKGIINNNGIQLINNDKNYFNIINSDEHIDITFNTSSKDTMILPILAFGHIYNDSISFNGVIRDQIIYKWDKGVFDIEFPEDINYIPYIVNINDSVDKINILKTKKSLKIFTNKKTPFEFDFILFASV